MSEAVGGLAGQFSWVRQSHTTSLPIALHYYCEPKGCEYRINLTSALASLQERSVTKQRDAADMTVLENVTVLTCHSLMHKAGTNLPNNFLRSKTAGEIRSSFQENDVTEKRPWNT